MKDEKKNNAQRHTAEQIQAYNKKARAEHDCITVQLPKGAKQKIKNYGYTINGFFVDLYNQWNDAHPENDPQEKPPTESKKKDYSHLFDDNRPLPFD